MNFFLALCARLEGQDVSGVLLVYSHGLCVTRSILVISYHLFHFGNIIDLSRLVDNENLENWEAVLIKILF